MEDTQPAPQILPEPVSKEPVQAVVQNQQSKPFEISEPERIFLDFETTGLDTLRDQIVQVRIADESGKVLLDQVVMPTCPISEKAIKIHGLTIDVLQNKKARSIKEVIPKIIEAIKGKRVVTYKTVDGDMLPIECQQDVAPEFCDCFECFSKVNPSVRGRGARTLEAAAAFYNHPPRSGEEHKASEDSDLCRKICISLKERRCKPCPERYFPRKKRGPDRLSALDAIEDIY